MDPTPTKNNLPLRKLLITCNAEIAIAQETHLPFLMKAAASLDLSFYGGTRAFVHLPEADAQLQPSEADGLAYLQFTSAHYMSVGPVSWMAITVTTMPPGGFYQKKDG